MASIAETKKDDFKLLLDECLIFLLDDDLTIVEKIKSELMNRRFMWVELGTHQKHPIDLALEGKICVLVADRRMPYQKDSGLHKSEELDTGIAMLEFLSETMNKKSMPYIHILYSDFPVAPDSREEKILRKWGIHFVKKSTGHQDLIEKIIELIISLEKYSSIPVDYFTNEEMLQTVRSRNKVEGFDRMVGPLIEWLEKEDNEKGEIFEGSKPISYREMAQLIKNGDKIGIKYANEFIDEERNAIKELKAMIKLT